MISGAFNSKKGVRPNFTKRKLRQTPALGVASAVVLALCLALLNPWRDARSITAAEPRVERTGWLADAVDAFGVWRSSLPAFRIVDERGNAATQDNRRLNVRLFELKRLAFNGDPSNGPQLTGDCTSWAAAHAIETTLACRLLDQREFARVFPTFLYAVGRVEIYRPALLELKKPMPPEGCSIAAVLKGAQQRGYLSWDEAKSAGYEYSGQLADSWGKTGPPKNLYPIAAQHKVLRFSPLTNSGEVRDAVCNGYGVPFGSDFTWKEYKEIDGRVVAIDCTAATPEDDRYGHAMCCDGYDGSTEHGPWYHVQNSWYPDSHPRPTDGSPVCGFWIDTNAMTYIVSKKETFGVSAAEGFRSRDPRRYPPCVRGLSDPDKQ